MSNSSCASVTVTKALEIEVFALTEGVQRTVKVKLGRIEAQRMAETLRRFALGEASKSVPGGAKVLFLATDTSGQPFASSRPVIRLG